MRRTALALAASVVASAAFPALAQHRGIERLEIASPLSVARGAAPAEFATALAFSGDRYAAVARASAVRLTGFPLAENFTIDLDLQQFDILSPDAQLIVADGEQERIVPRPDVVLLRGQVAGLAESSVFLSLSPHGSNGFIRLPQQSWIISTPADDAEAPTVIYELSALPPDAMVWQQFQCGTDDLEAREPRLERLLHQAAMMPMRSARPSGGAGGGMGNIDGLPCRRVRIAVDTDWQYTGTVFGGNTTTSQAYVMTLLGAVSEIYISEINTSLEVVYVRVWETNNTPYSATTVNDRLTEFRAHWNSNMGSVSRNIAHLFTGLRSGAGGVAYLGVLCGGSFAYGVSGYINGGFPYPLQNNHPQNWDIMVTAHEIGHNFNAPHTHSTSPPIDGCGSGNCAGANQGTIMSYCHTCSGGMSNISLVLHQRIINEHILPYMSSASCAASLLCPVPPGACCLPMGGCDFMDQHACNLIAGATFAGAGIQCAAANCPQSGACCLADGSCVMVTEALCSSIFNGTFNGSSNCGEGRCATAPVLWNHGPIITNAAGGCSGRAVSAVQTSIGNSTRGFSWAATGSRIADEFIVPEGEQWLINRIVLFGYEVSTNNPTYTSARIRIWDGDPRDPQSSVIAGDLTTNRLTNASFMNVHRAFQSGLTSCDRRIQRLECSFEATLGPGTYWIERTATAPSTPWMPLVTFAGLTGKPGGKAIQSSGQSWVELRDAGTSAPQDAPFIIEGVRQSSCYANCDGSTVEPILNIDDFTCFINEFAGGQTLPHEQQISHYANCDGSTTAPVLNIDDFTCFINGFALGCP